VNILAYWLVKQPLHILLIAVALAVLWGLLRRRARYASRASALLAAAVAWLGYAGWEWWVLVKTPEADIRVDLLVIWPLVAIVTLWAILRVAMAPKSGAPRNP
jgi:hypothetical protein